MRGEEKESVEAKIIRKLPYLPTLVRTPQITRRTARMSLTESPRNTPGTGSRRRTNIVTKLSKISMEFLSTIKTLMATSEPVRGC